MADLYLFKPGDDDERARFHAEREARRAGVRARYTAHLTDRTGLDDITADLVMATLFDHLDTDGNACWRTNHPTLPEGGEHSHDAGFDCPCTWDQARKERERAQQRASWNDWMSSPEAEAMRVEDDLERAAVEEWIARHPGVKAEQTVPACPEVWEGTIDGHSFFFRERSGSWRIEIDLVPNGRFANRVVSTAPDGEIITEPVELTSGEVIAEGCAATLGMGPVAHLSFIVDAVRTHLARMSCLHPRAEQYCPACGFRIDAIGD